MRKTEKVERLKLIERDKVRQDVGRAFEGILLFAAIWTQADPANPASKNIQISRTLVDALPHLNMQRN